MRKNKQANYRAAKASSRQKVWDKQAILRAGKKKAPRGPKSLKEEAEFGPGKAELIFCSGCGIVYYHKSWHHRFEDYGHLNENKAVNFSLCPACRMIKGRIFEGEIVITGFTDKERKEEVKRAVKNSGNLAFERDPLDRVIDIDDKNNKLTVHTTENQLAVRIGKKIKQTFGGQMEIAHSHEADIIRVKINLG